MPSAIRPAAGGKNLKKERSAQDTSKQNSSFIPDFRGVDASTCESLKGVGSFSVTQDHWADPNTSRALVQEILRPHYAEYCAKNNLPLGEQKCLLLVDCWWGWLYKEF